MRHCNRPSLKKQQEIRASIEAANISEFARVFRARHRALTSGSKDGGKECNSISEFARVFRARHRALTSGSKDV